MTKKKQTKPTRSVHPPAAAPLMLPEFIRNHPAIWTAVLLFVLLILLFHQNVISGKQFLGADTLKSTMCYQPFINKALDAGNYPLWNPYIFSGMPSFASLSSAPRVNVVDTVVNNILHFLTGNDFIRIFLNYLLFGWLMFLLLRHYNVQPGPALFAAIAVVFMPQFIAFGVHGHNTKLLTLTLIPLILILIDRLFEKRNLFYLALTALVLGFQLFRAHVQVCFYTYLLIGIYFIFYAVNTLRQQKTGVPVLKSAALLGLALLLALGLSSVIYLSVYEYSSYSIRGGGAQGGLDYDYATGWSFSPLEMLTFFVPGFVGFGGQTYWGPMGFTDYPLYMSILALYFMGFAFVLERKNRLVWLFGFVALFSLLVSFGNHFPLLYNPMFNWIPFFDKFRIPSMIHILLDIAVAILAAIGLNSLVKLTQTREESGKALQASKIYSYIFGGLAVLLLLLLILGESAYLAFAAKSTKITMLTSQGYPLEQLSRYILEPAYAIARTDALKMVVILALALVAVFAFLRRKISQLVLFLILIPLVVVDLWLIDFEIIKDKLTQNAEARLTDPALHFRETSVVKFLKEQQQADLFRIYPTESGEYNWYMYHQIPSVFGYNPAKLRIYQEMLEGFQVDPGRPLNLGSFKMLSLLNTRYFISQKTVPGCQIVPGFENSPVKVFESGYAMPRAFFVARDTVFTPPTDLLSSKASYENHRNAIFKFIQSRQFEGSETAILEENPPFAIGNPAGNSVAITQYDIHRIELKATVAEPAHLVLSEIYYPAGWKALVDGQETQIYKTNYLLRSIFLTPGSHQITFVFEPFLFKLGMWISIGLAGVLVGIAIFCGLRQRKLATA